MRMPGSAVTIRQISSVVVEQDLHSLQQDQDGTGFSVQSPTQFHNDTSVGPNKGFVNAINDKGDEVVSCLAKPFMEVDVDGACADNGGAKPRGGCGIFWAPEHPWNASIPLPDYDKKATKGLSFIHGS
jgi:hypothetical protein